MSTLVPSVTLSVEEGHSPVALQLDVNQPYPQPLFQFTTPISTKIDHGVHHGNELVDDEPQKESFQTVKDSAELLSMMTHKKTVDASINDDQMQCETIPETHDPVVQKYVSSGNLYFTQSSNGALVTCTMEKNNTVVEHNTESNNELTLVKKSTTSSSSTTRRGTLDRQAKSILKKWMFSREHFSHPYPTEEEKEELANKASVDVKQLSNWFTNARKRLWQPVLRKAGVDVKKFLSTGRGGPRGATLELPTNIEELVGQLSSPSSSPRQLRQYKAQAWASYKATTTPTHLHQSPQEMECKREYEMYKRHLSTLDMRKTWTKRIRNSVANKANKEEEVRAAESLLGLLVCTPKAAASGKTLYK